MKILTVAGARPNFVKIAPLHRAFSACPDFDSKIVHTGQHSSFWMSGVFFNQLGLPQPDYSLDINEGSPATQTARTMLAFEKVVLKEKPDLIVVVGDVNSSLACALVAVKLCIPVAHVEAGLRCGKLEMPEEINRKIIGNIASLHFASEPAAVENLLRENFPANSIHLVGNVMIDSLVNAMPEIDKICLMKQYGIAKPYILLTMHRPQNVDSKPALERLFDLLKTLARHYTVIFPVHPRTMNNINRFGLINVFSEAANLHLLQPAGYIEFLSLTKNALLVITDSGGVQEETTFLQVPCITLRNETERPITVSEGTNHLVADYSAQKVWQVVEEILAKPDQNGSIPAGWDGNAATRIAAILKEKFINS